MEKIIKNSSGKVLKNSNGIFKVDATIDSNIVASNIKKDINILGVTGTYAGDPWTEMEVSSTRINAYINDSEKWVSSNDSYSIAVPVTSGKLYKIEWVSTNSSTVGTIFRYGFSSTNTATSQSLSQCVRTSPQSTPVIALVADNNYLIIQASASTFVSVISNNYMIVWEQDSSSGSASDTTFYTGTIISSGSSDPFPVPGTFIQFEVQYPNNSNKTPDMFIVYDENKNLTNGTVNYAVINSLQNHSDVWYGGTLGNNIHILTSTSSSTTFEFESGTFDASFDVTKFQFAPIYLSE